MCTLTLVLSVRARQHKGNSAFLQSEQDNTKANVHSYITSSVGTGQHRGNCVLFTCFSCSKQVGVGNTKQIVSSYILFSIGTGQHESKRALLHYVFVNI